MTEETTFPIERVDFDEEYIDHPFIPSRDPERVEAFLTAFAAAQRNYTPVVRDKLVKIRPRDKPEYSFKYAELANVQAATKALHDEGISVSQPLHEDRQGITWLYTIMTHAKGAGRVTRIKLGGSEDIKAFGGIVTYLRRYCYAPAVGVASEDDADEDGREADGSGEDGGGFRREREEASAPAPRPSAVARKSASAPAAAAEAKATLVTAGQLKNLQLKAVSKMDEQAVAAMLERLGVPALDASMSLDDWKKVNAELTNS